MRGMGDSRGPVDWVAGDLAPGDGGAALLDTTPLRVDDINSVDHPLFGEAYRILWEEFGPSGGMETEDVIALRLHCSGSARFDGWTLCYQLLIVRDADGWAAVRDHSVAIPPSAFDVAPWPVTVHLSHLLVAPRWRRRGLACWMRAMPLQTVRECRLTRTDLSRDVGVTLVAEMDPPVPDKPERTRRMLAYGKAGFRRVAPSKVRYRQPDFRPPAIIDATGGARPIPMELLLRRVGREGEASIDGAEARMIVDSLYRVYAEGCRADDMQPLREDLLHNYPPPGEPVPLLIPGQLFAG